MVLSVEERKALLAVCARHCCFRVLLRRQQKNLHLCERRWSVTLDNLPTLAACSSVTKKWNDKYFCYYHYQLPKKRYDDYNRCCYISITTIISLRKTYLPDRFGSLERRDIAKGKYERIRKKKPEKALSGPCITKIAARYEIHIHAGTPCQH